MPRLRKLNGYLPSRSSALLAALGSMMLAVSFPDFGFSWLAWFSFVPLLFALRPQSGPASARFLTGWLFGTLFFFVTCWWLTFAPITYARFPVVPTYMLLLAATAASGVFAAAFGWAYSIVRKRFGAAGVLSAPFLWTATEFARYWITGNNWNAVGYSQAFDPVFIGNASIGGVYLTGFAVVLSSAVAVFVFDAITKPEDGGRKKPAVIAAALLTVAISASIVIPLLGERRDGPPASARLIAVQPNVPMAGLNFESWRKLRTRQVELAKQGIRSAPRDRLPGLVVLPESPMNYQYELDPEFREFINGFARENGVSVLFNSAEPDRSRERGFFNAAVLVDENGEKDGQYDKIYLLPFGEFVPLPEFAQELVPPMVGRFSHGSEYDLFDIGGAKAGVMICFESHFAALSAEYVRNGADLIIEMTNDGYLGETPVLRQHLANAVFRAVETGRPVYRVTNVGVTARIDEYGGIHEEAPVYKEDVRVWEVSRSAGGLTFYVRAGDWFAVLCLLISVGALAYPAARRRMDA